MLKAIAALSTLACATATFAADADLARVLNQADVVFVGTVASSRLGPAVGRSYPPVYTVFVTFDRVQMLKGKQPKDLTFSQQVRAHQPPSYAKGAKLLAALNAYPHDASRFGITRLVEATADAVALAKRATALPAGWSEKDGKPVSPWAGQGAGAWPAAVWKTASKPAAGPVCSKTGRPALKAGEGVTLKVEQVIPKNAHKWRNPFGNGEFRITVTNTTAADAVVPAVLTDGARILWEPSLVVLSNGTHVFPATPAPKALGSLRLKAGQSVSGVVNTLKLPAVRWPRGGSRVSLKFCLGELTATNFFYYLSRHHDPLRRRATQKN